MRYRLTLWLDDEGAPLSAGMALVPDGEDLGEEVVRPFFGSDQTAEDALEEMWARRPLMAQLAMPFTPAAARRSRR